MPPRHFIPVTHCNWNLPSPPRALPTPRSMFAQTPALHPLCPEAQHLSHQRVGVIQTQSHPEWLPTNLSDSLPYGPTMESATKIHGRQCAFHLLGRWHILMSIRHPEGTVPSSVPFCPVLRHHTHTHHTCVHAHKYMHTYIHARAHTYIHAHLETSFLGLHRPPIVIATELTWVLPPEVEDVPHTHP